MSSEQQQQRVIFPAWTRLTAFCRRCIYAFVHLLSQHAIRNPIHYILSLTLLSLALGAIGFLTNFRIELEIETIYSPFAGQPRSNLNWIREESQLMYPRAFSILIHKEGENIVDYESMDRVFQAIDCVRKTPGYDEICETHNYTDYNGVNTCRILSPTRFWFHDYDLFKEEVKSEEDFINQVSQEEMPGGLPSSYNLFFGNYEMTTDELSNKNASWTSLLSYVNKDHSSSKSSQRLSYASSIMIRIEMPDVGEDSDKFEKMALEQCVIERDLWINEEGNAVRMDFMTVYGYSLEFARAINSDLPLIIVVAIIMTVFTMWAFHRKHLIYSRSLLGLSAVSTVVMSLVSGYGFMWIIGVPFTCMHQILPFIIIGVGLDDVFIISGAFDRTDSRKSIEERMRHTMDEVGLSITTTTITTILAFILGSLSSIPGIKWLCWYAIPTIFFVYIYQITVFVAFIVLDERRIAANRRDIFFWIIVNDDDDNNKDGAESYDENNTPREHDEKGNSNVPHEEHSDDTSSRFMVWYSNQLMKPASKVVVIVLFTLYLTFSAYNISQLTQEFNLKDFIPRGSYVSAFFDATDNYFTYTRTVGVYFRGVEQTQEDVMLDMIDYVEELASMDMFVDDIPICWVKDLNEQRETNLKLIQSLPFKEQMEFALSNPAVSEAFSEDIVRDEESGNITESRCWLLLSTNVDITNVTSQLEARVAEREVSSNFHANIGQHPEFNFFSFDDFYLYWEFFSVCVEELAFSIVTGIIAVTLIAKVLIPHWTSGLLIFPMMTICYINLLGSLKLAGLKINAITYICCVAAIGLLVDFLMHILLHYYQVSGRTREDKVHKVLLSMGSSIVLGGSSTFLGVIPLAFSTTTIFQSACSCFGIMIVLGIMHGLVLLPVVLSYWGPLINIEEQQEANNGNDNKKKKLNIGGKSLEEEEKDEEDKYQYLTTAAKSLCVSAPEEIYI